MTLTHSHHRHFSQSFCKLVPASAPSVPGLVVREHTDVGLASACLRIQGGLVVVGCSGGEHPFVPCELFDEESNRWYELPHGMVEPRVAARVVSIPADALRHRRR